MSDWRLRTEPWTFLFAELEPALAQLAAGKPVQPPATQ